jgi:hypothetical protein
MGEAYSTHSLKPLDPPPKKKTYTKRQINLLHNPLTTATLAAIRWTPLRTFCTHSAYQMSQCIPPLHNRGQDFDFHYC